jgi:FkbM family methyltransferase
MKALSGGIICVAFVLVSVLCVLTVLQSEESILPNKLVSLTKEQNDDKKNSFTLPFIPHKFAVAYTKTMHPFHIAVPSHENDYLRFDIYTRDTYYERELTNIIEAAMQATTEEQIGMIDVGANVGWVTYLAASFGRETWSFEVDKRSLNYLEFTKYLNPGFEDRVHLFKQAVSDTDGEIVKFNLHSQNPGQSQIVDAKSPNYSYNVTTVTLDTLLPKQRYAMLKVDTEGHEDYVLRGARKLLSAGLVSYIHLEWGYPDLELMKNLFQWGYRPMVKLEHFRSFWNSTYDEICSERKITSSTCREAIREQFTDPTNSKGRTVFNMVLRHKTAKEFEIPK